MWCVCLVYLSIKGCICLLRSVWSQVDSRCHLVDNTFLVEVGSLTEPGPHSFNLVGWPVKLWICLFLHPKPWGYRCALLHQICFVGAGHPSSGSYTFTANSHWAIFLIPGMHLHPRTSNWPALPCSQAVQPHPWNPVSLQKRQGKSLLFTKIHSRVLQNWELLEYI